MRKLHWCHAMIALVISLVLVVGGAELTQAKTSRVKRSQVPQVDCNFVLTKPFKQGRSIKANGVVYCRGVKQSEITVRLQKSTDGGWVTLAEDSAVDIGLDVSAPCSTPEKKLYRSYITGKYRTTSGWYDIPGHEEEHELIACE